MWAVSFKINELYPERMTVLKLTLPHIQGSTKKLTQKINSNNRLFSTNALKSLKNIEQD